MACVVATPCATPIPAGIGTIDRASFQRCAPLHNAASTTSPAPARAADGVPTVRTALRRPSVKEPATLPDYRLRERFRMDAGRITTLHGGSNNGFVFSRQ